MVVRSVAASAITPGYPPLVGFSTNDSPSLAGRSGAGDAAGQLPELVAGALDVLGHRFGRGLGLLPLDRGEDVLVVGEALDAAVLHSSSAGSNSSPRARSTATASRSFPRAMAIEAWNATSASR